MSRPLIIAFDGPSGSGKNPSGADARARTEIAYIDTGSMYRAVALAVIESTINETDDVAVGSRRKGSTLIWRAILDRCT